MRYQSLSAESKNELSEKPLEYSPEAFLLSKNKKSLYIWYRIILFLQKYGFVRFRAGSNFVSSGICRNLRLCAITA